MDSVVIAGDLFDRPRPSNRALRAAVEGLRRLVNRGVKVYLVLGEHDYPRGGDISPIHLAANIVGEGVYAPPTSVPPGASALEIVRLHTVKAGSGHVILLPFIRSIRERRVKATGMLLEAARALARGLDGPAILLAHLGLESYTYPEDAVASPAQLEGFDYAALGHIHKRIISDTPTTWAYPASLVALNAGEARLDMEGMERGPLLVEVWRGGARVEEVRVEKPRIQVHLEARARTRTELVEAARRLLQEAGWRPGMEPRPLVHLALTLPRGAKLTPRGAVEALARMGVLARLAGVKSEAPLPGGDPREPAPAGGDEVEVIRRLLDPRGRHPEAAERLARGIVELKKAAAKPEPSVEEVEELLNNLVSGPGYDEAWRLVVGGQRRLQLL